MTTQGAQVIRREHQATIKQIAETTQRGQLVWQVSTDPRPGMEYPDNFTVRSKELRDKLSAGKTVLLVLQRESLKRRKDGTSGPADSPWSYYEAIVDVREAGTAASAPPPSTAPSAGASQAPVGSGSGEAWDRYIGWADILRLGWEIRGQLYGDIPTKGGGEIDGDVVAGQYDYAVSLLVNTLKAQKGIA